MKTLCAWCLRESGSEAEEGVSHGICAQHAINLLEQEYREVMAGYVGLSVEGKRSHGFELRRALRGIRSDIDDLKASLDDPTAD